MSEQNPSMDLTFQHKSGIQNLFERQVNMQLTHLNNTNAVLATECFHEENVEVLQWIIGFRNVGKDTDHDGRRVARKIDIWV